MKVALIVDYAVCCAHKDHSDWYYLHERRSGDNGHKHKAVFFSSFWQLRGVQFAYQKVVDLVLYHKITSTDFFGFASSKFPNYHPDGEPQLGLNNYTVCKFG